MKLISIVLLAFASFSALADESYTSGHHISPGFGVGSVQCLGLLRFCRLRLYQLAAFSGWVHFHPSSQPDQQTSGASCPTENVGRTPLPAAGPEFILKPGTNSIFSRSNGHRSGGCANHFSLIKAT